jgi:hypothetical protein
MPDLTSEDQEHEGCRQRLPPPMIHAGSARRGICCHSVRRPTWRGSARALYLRSALL